MTYKASIPWVLDKSILKAPKGKIKMAIPRQEGDQWKMKKQMALTVMVASPGLV